MRAAVLAMAFSGCERGGESSADAGTPMCEVKRDVVDQHLWTAVAFEDDPFAAEIDAPASRRDGGGGGPVPCTAEDQRYEDFGGEPSWTVYTRACSWATAGQPSLVDVGPDDELSIRVWYFSQTASEPAEAHVIVSRDAGRPIWSGVVPIPVDTGGLLFETFTLGEAMPAGTPILWHVDNHGSNSWNFLELSVTGEAPCAELDTGVP